MFIHNHFHTYSIAQSRTSVVLPLNFLNFLNHHLNAMLSTCPRAAVLLNDTAGVALIHRLDEFGAAIGECYCEYAFLCFHHL